jgi:hypothetical protein
MSIPLRSRFVYGVAGASDWSMTLPPGAWGRRSGSVGGSRKSAAGVPAAYTVRRDEVLILPLRFYESEWTSVYAMLRWGQSGESMTWYPDADVTTESYEVWLETPAAGEDVTPTRSTEYPLMLELSIGLRAVDATPWSIEFYGL